MKLKKVTPNQRPAASEGGAAGGGSAGGPPPPPMGGMASGHIDLAAVLGARAKMKKVGEISRAPVQEAPKPVFTANLKKVKPAAPKQQPESVQQVSFLSQLKSVQK